MAMAVGMAFKLAGVKSLGSTTPGSIFTKFPSQLPASSSGTTFVKPATTFVKTNVKGLTGQPGVTLVYDPNLPQPNTIAGRLLGGATTPPKGMFADPKLASSGIHSPQGPAIGKPTRVKPRRPF